MRNDLTDIVLVIDRSGSMFSCKETATLAINQFLEKQRQQPGEARVTLVEFADMVKTKKLRAPIHEIEQYNLVPGGNTALLDAIGVAVTKEGELLSELRECDRPGLVIVAIMTDGQENCSKMYRSRAKIKEMIRVQTEVYKWQFTYLGADQDAFAEAESLGIAKGSTLNFDKGKTDYGVALSNNVCRMRSAVAGGQGAKSGYTAEEVKNVM